MAPGILYVFYDGDLLLTVDSNGSRLVLDGLEHRALKQYILLLTVLDLARKLRLPIAKACRVVEKLRDKSLIKTTLEGFRNGRPSNNEILYKPRTRTTNRQNIDTVNFLIMSIDPPPNEQFLWYKQLGEERIPYWFPNRSL